MNVFCFPLACRFWTPQKKRKTTAPVCSGKGSIAASYRPSVNTRSSVNNRVVFVPSVRPRSNPDGTLSRPAAPSPPPNSALDFVGLLPEFRRYGRPEKPTGRFILQRSSKWNFCLASCRGKYSTHYTNEKSITSRGFLPRTKLPLISSGYLVSTIFNSVSVHTIISFYSTPLLVVIVEYSSLDFGKYYIQLQLWNRIRTHYVYLYRKNYSHAC